MCIINRKYVKEQKTVRENIARMSSKPMFKVQEEVASMKQLLALVSNGLQRNAIAIDKLKSESAMVSSWGYLNKISNTVVRSFTYLLHTSLLPRLMS